MLVNDTRVELPVVHVEGDKYGDKVEFFFLDDERNPLTLAFRIGIGLEKPLSPHALEACRQDPDEARVAYRCDLPNGGDRETLRVTTITHRCGDSALSPGGSPDSGAPAFERALAEQGRVDLYSIHFSFNSDTIRDESEATLNEIASVLGRHPDWKLLINGHTDSIGAPNSNVDLSKRRAAAVKTALVSRYAISANRLTTWGLGESYPKDTNDTLEGRARNRRVELKQQP